MVVVVVGGGHRVGEGGPMECRGRVEDVMDPRGDLCDEHIDKASDGVMCQQWHIQHLLGLGEL